MKVAIPLRGRSQGRGKRAAVRCYACGQLGDYQRFCKLRQARILIFPNGKKNV